MSAAMDRASLPSELEAVVAAREGPGAAVVAVDAGVAALAVSWSTGAGLGGSGTAGLGAWIQATEVPSL
jgi:hypothetical protein